MRDCRAATLLEQQAKQSRAAAAAVAAAAAAGGEGEAQGGKARLGRRESAADEEELSPGERAQRAAAEQLFVG